MLGKVFSYFNKKPWFLNIEHVLIALSDLFLPRFCLVCGRRLHSTETHLCIYCFCDLPFTRYSGRGRNPMADRFNALMESRLLYHQKEVPFYVESPSFQSQAGGSGVLPSYIYASALFFYNSESGYKLIPQALKYHADLASGRFFSGILGRELSSSRLFKDVDIVMPVPLHRSRKWERGYNQAEIIAKEVAYALKATLLIDVLYRKRRTRTQTRLSSENKYKNVAGAFAVNEKRLSYGLAVRNKALKEKDFSQGKGGLKHHILLVDDVFTTGSTLVSCFSALFASFDKSPEIYGSCRISVASLCFVYET